MAGNELDEELQLVVIIVRLVVSTWQLWCIMSRRSRVPRLLSLPDAPIIRNPYLKRMVYESERACIENIRMDQICFRRLCDMLKSHGKLVDTNNMSAEEMVIIFLHIVGHDVKNKAILHQMCRPGESINRHFHSVLMAIFRCVHLLVNQPDPVPVESTNESWKWFKNCLGALDGTYVQVQVNDEDKPRYRTRNGEIATYVLGVCNRDMQFVYILPGWEGSVEDATVLHDAKTRRNNFKVPPGFYYLVDAKYPNHEGFLAPYKEERYHLSDWCPGYQPNTPREFFNMKHSECRNIINRCFGLLKARWVILRSKPFSPVKTHVRIISACCLLHNFIRQHMEMDPLEDVDLSDYIPQPDMVVSDDEEEMDIYMESSAWDIWRDNLAEQMFNDWMSSRH